MPSFHATRRASARSSIVQQPPYGESAAARLSYICIDSPTTSCPCEASRYAAVDESTPPDIATAIFIGGWSGGWWTVVKSELTNRPLYHHPPSNTPPSNSPSAT